MKETSKETYVDEYFQSYENLEVHELMLLDRSRTGAYREAILQNEELFKDKIVMDIGCGTGILSLFCAQAGAKRVFAIEASNVASLAEELVTENDFEEIVEVFHGKVEDFKLPVGVDSVDIIVSEWMGFYLVHESMLESYLFARDKFLKKDGLMFPDTASIYTAPCQLPQMFELWEEFSGVKMSTFGQKLRAQKSCKPEIIQLDPSFLLHSGELLSWLDLKTVTREDVDDLSETFLMLSQEYGNFQGVCIWFECTFPSIGDNLPITLSTSPKAEATHWKQTVIVLPDASILTVEPNEAMAYELSIKRNPSSARGYTLQLDQIDSDEVDHPVPCDCILTKCIVLKTHLKKLECGDIEASDEENGESDNEEESARE
ncbi:protein arginine N-methyltransferase 6 [Phlebotomus argentipes]|uniref:protein arginine N-methyltransferase 6 n=1 Tax=Phlebotomus argentipes TaxID=94469 RepID=UPI002892B4B1|nr:protein arginine N-methyltransferase 6 [Phlebotomus argentipes]